MHLRHGWTLLLPVMAAVMAIAGKGSAPMSFTIHSTAFQNGGEIPRKYTCQGEDLSPPLAWSEPPVHTASLALIVEDPDAPAGTWVHWVLFGVPAPMHTLPEGASSPRHLPAGMREGMNDFQHLGYGGPCPPPGKAHRYFFRLYALDSEMALPSGSSRKELDKAMQGHILAQAELMGTYQRR